MSYGEEAHEVIDPRFGHFLLGNAALEVLASGFRWTEGPVWMGDWNCLLFQDLPDNRTMRWIPDAGISIYRAPSAYANGQARDREGRLVSCSHRDRCIFRIERDGSRTVIADRHAGKRLNSPNDIAVHPDGAIWFTDPLYGIATDYEGGRQKSEQPPALYRLDPSGALRIMADDFAGPNGLAFTSDGARLFVAETGDQTADDPAQFIRAFDVQGGSRLTGGARFHTVSPGYCDGMAVDAGGYLWASARDGVHCIDPSGTLIGKILIPDRVSNLCFGGPDMNRLFICGSDKLYGIYLNRRGAGGA